MDAPRAEKKPFKGFQPQDPEIRRQIKILMRAETSRTLVTLAQEWLIILSMATLSWIIFVKLNWSFLAVCLYSFAITVIASRQRALECLIHEATHVNLSRDLKINDRLAWIFAALPLGHNLKTERLSHLIGHHKNFWDTELDPDYRRYRQIGIDQLPAGSYLELVQILARGFLPYIRSTIPAFFLPKEEERYVRLLRVGFWTLVIITSTFTGLFLPLLLYWVVPFLTILVIIRYLGEASEHAALNCTDEFGTTRNNLGWLNEHFIHPRGDAYHLVHHLYPKVPYHNAAKAHKLLMSDPIYRNTGHHCTGLVVKRTEQRTTLQSLTTVR